MTAYAYAVMLFSTFSFLTHASIVQNTLYAIKRFFRPETLPNRSHLKQLQNVHLPDAQKGRTLYALCLLYIS